MTPLCPLESIEDRHARAFTAEHAGDLVSLFVVRKGDRIFGYVNSCPHTGAPLDWQENGFLDLFRTDILCSLHGARFFIENGHCHAGPCKGRDLKPLPVRVIDGVIHLEGAITGEIDAFLSAPGVLGEGVPEKAETHISVVYLSGQRAFKRKRPVRLAFLDFSTRGARAAACRDELELNRRTSPELYLGLRRVTREADGGLALDGEGETLEWLVEMRRFAEADRLDLVAGRGEFGREAQTGLAETVAEFHAQAEVIADQGGADGAAWVIANNRQAFAGPGGDIFDPARIEELSARQQEWLDRLSPLLEERRAAGRVRRCHGDLHLRNICLIDGRPRLFDCIEFSREIACVDVFYDLAFLLMDLDHRGFRPAASLILGHYAGVTGDVGGLAALPLFLSLRASIRAHVAAATAALGKNEAAGEETKAARAYLERAFLYLDPPKPRLIAVGGLSGSGKSRLAREIAPSVGAAPGAVVLRSDVIRKRLAGVAPLVRLSAEEYGAEMTERTYSTLYAEAEAGLAAGHSVIADAVFARPEQRLAIARVAEKAGTPFTGLWAEAPFEVLAERIERRKGNASDATIEVLRRQMEYDLGEIGWIAIDSSGPREQSLALAIKALGL